MNIRAVKTGRTVVYMGNALGGIYIDTIELKGDPKTWVEDSLKSRHKKEVGQIIFNMSEIENKTYPFTKGTKMGRNSFWRNAWSYFNNLEKSKR